ncbi:MAG TPA: hypothetical protein VK909_18400 [Anaerolineales bacterium]|nr:hypothetical protein [Anaerolineales bacterium]
MAFALLESLAATGLLILFSALVPSTWLRDGFAYKGFVILLIATVDAFLVQKSLEEVFPSTFHLILFSIVPIVLIAVLIRVLHTKPQLQNLLVKVQDRFLIMLFVYLPIGIISLLAVTVRNLV